MVVFVLLSILNAILMTVEYSTKYIYIYNNLTNILLQGI